MLGVSRGQSAAVLMMRGCRRANRGATSSLLSEGNQGSKDGGIIGEQFFNEFGEVAHEFQRRHPGPSPLADAPAQHVKDIAQGSGACRWLRWSIIALPRLEGVRDIERSTKTRRHLDRHEVISASGNRASTRGRISNLVKARMAVKVWGEMYGGKCEMTTGLLAVRGGYLPEFPHANSAARGGLRPLWDEES